jgi:hypothetical protein
MYKKKLVKTQNAKNPTEHPSKGSSKIVVHRTSSNANPQSQKSNHQNPHTAHATHTSTAKQAPAPAPPQKSSSFKNYSISSETVKKILLSFYPKDKSLFDIILSPLNKATFLFDLDKYYSKLDEFSNKDPFNKYYGVQSSAKLNIKENQSSMDLNKENTDIIFSLVDQVLASFGTKLNINTIKGNINNIYKCHNLNRINFISNKEKNGRSLYPVNFYVFCLSLKMLIECYSEQIKYFDMGVFMNSAETMFGKDNNDCFLSELFCCYIVFLYFYSVLTKHHDVCLNLHFFDDSSIYDNFTFHISENGFNKVNEILAKNKDKYDVMTLLKEIFTVNLNKLNFHFHYNITNDVYGQIVELLNCQDYLTKVEFYCPENFINNAKYDIIKDIQKCKELNFYIKKGINAKTKINKISDDLHNISNFAIYGENLFIENLPKNIKNLNSLKLVSKTDNSNAPYYSEQYEKEKICLNITQESFNNLDNIQELSLKFLSLEQFLWLVNSLNAKTSEKKSDLFKLDIEVDYSFSNLIKEQNKNQNNNVEELNKNLILKAINLLINYSPRIKKIRELSINLVNNSPCNNFILSTENGLYFIDLVLNKLKYCYNFSLVNNNNNYYPPDEEKPDTTLTGNGRRARKNVKKKNIENEEFCTNDNKHNCRCEWNHNNEIYVSYNGNEYNNCSKFCDIDNFVPFLFAVEKKLKKLKVKPILLHIAKCLDIIKNKPKQFHVTNFNN